MSLFSRLWRAFRNPARFVGHDLEGNRFFEHPSPHADARMKRTVEYRHPEDMWDYVGGKKRLAVQWSAWLSHTRTNPPTLQELQLDFERQRRVLANVALIEARDAAERQQMLQLQAENMKSIEASRAPDPPSTEQIAEPPKQAEQQPELDPEADPWRKASLEATDTQTWVPRARRRGADSSS